MRDQSGAFLLDMRRQAIGMDGTPETLSAWFNTPQELTRWARYESGDLEHWLAAGASGSQYRAIWDAHALAMAVLDRSGDVISASDTFRSEGGEAMIDRDAVAAAAATPQPVFVPVTLNSNQIALIAYAVAKVARHWQLPVEALAILEQRPDAVVMLTTVTRRAEPLARACEAYGLTDLQRRIVLAVLDTGSVKSAAAQAGVAYATARETMSDVFRRAGVRGTPGLIMKLSALAFGVLPTVSGANPLLTDLWGLTERQAAVAALVAEGQSRAEVAGLLGLSGAVVKKEIERVFATLGLNSAAALARTLSETVALSLMTTVTGGALGFTHPSAEPLRFVLRPDGTRIAVSDYGPASASPCVIVHSSMTTRPAARRLVIALQRRGYRPISIDRPGFGMTDESADSAAKGYDPFAAAAADFVLVAKKLRLARADFVMRGAAPFILALDALAPEMIGRVVLVNPDIHTDATGRRQDPLGAFKEAYMRNPRIIAMMAGVLAANVTFDRTHAMLSRSMAGSPPDEAGMRDPEVAEDLYRAGRMFATGRISGYVAEQIWFARAGATNARPDRPGWHILLGAHDTLHDPIEVEAYWRRLLPDSSIEYVSTAGRLMALTHSELVAARL